MSKSEQRKGRIARVTRLEAFIRANKIHRGKFAKAIRYLSSYVRAVRRGEEIPSRERMQEFAEACAHFVGRPVALSEIFDLEHIYRNFHVPLMCSISAVFVAASDTTDVVAYVPELAGVHGQGATLPEAKESLAQALEMLLEANRRTARETFGGAKELHREGVVCVPPRRWKGEA